MLLKSCCIWWLHVMLLSTFTPLQSCSVLQRCLYLQNILFRNKGTCLFGKGPTPSTSALPPPRLCFQPCLFVCFLSLVGLSAGLSKMGLGPEQTPFNFGGDSDKGIFFLPNFLWHGEKGCLSTFSLISYLGGWYLWVSTIWCRSFIWWFSIMVK